MNLPQLTFQNCLFLSVLAFSLTFGLQAQASTNPLSFSPNSLRFGDVVVGQSESLPINLTNRSTSSISISTLSARRRLFRELSPRSPRTLGAGKSLALTVTFSPTASISDPGTLLINGKTAIDLHGAGTSNKSVVPTPPSVSFGNVQTGSTALSRVTVTNNKSGNTTISSTVIKGTGFSVQGLSLPLTLTPGQSFTFTLAFSPTSAGSVSGSFQALNPRNYTSVSIPLSGMGTAGGEFSLSPASISFGNVTVGSSATHSGTLTATGASVTITADSSTNSEFTLSGLSFPMTIAAGKSVSFTVAFAPQSSGSASANLSFANNASTVTESLTGSGVAVASHSVSLTWDPSTSQVNGYNVYRSSTAGGPYAKMNAGIDAGTSYVDSTVAASHTYYYVTTAVNSTGQERSYSNQVQVSVP